MRGRVKWVPRYTPHLSPGPRWTPWRPVMTAITSASSPSPSPEGYISLVMDVQTQQR